MRIVVAPQEFKGSLTATQAAHAIAAGVRSASVGVEAGGGGARAIIVGVGGSATVDAGAGAMQALGARLLDAAGRDLPRGGEALGRLERIDLAARDRRLLGASVRRFADVVQRDCGVDVRGMPGSGAAGGLAAGLVAVAGATLEPGSDLVAAATGLDGLIASCDAVITGEGRLDAQTPFGKTVAGVAAIARAHGKPVAVIAGTVDPAFDPSTAFDAVEPLSSPGLSLDEAMRLAGPLARAAPARVALRLADRPRR